MRKVGLVYISLIVILSLICWGFLKPVRGFAAMPHYIANFATRDYPVQPSGRYSARVVEHGVELGSVTFQADTASGASRGNSP